MSISKSYEKSADELVAKLLDGKSLADFTASLTSILSIMKGAGYYAVADGRLVFKKIDQETPTTPDALVCALRRALGGRIAKAPTVMPSASAEAAPVLRELTNTKPGADRQAFIAQNEAAIFHASLAFGAGKPCQLAAIPESPLAAKARADMAEAERQKAIVAEYAAMPPGDARLRFFEKHSSVIFAYRRNHQTR